MNRQPTNAGSANSVSIGIFAWNEEKAIAATLESLLGQSIFQRLASRNGGAEVVCVLNGCTDGTAQVAARALERLHATHPARSAFRFRVTNLLERGKNNAWNQFVHSISAREARVLFMMDADILIHEPDTLWNMLQLLETDPEAHIAVDRPCKDIAFKGHKSLRSHLSLASSEITQAAPAQLCAQLYAIRPETARNIYLPKDLAACEDGFIKALVCTDSLAHEVWPRRIRLAARAAHTFEAYTSLPAVLKNQKRQAIGQTIVHILIDKYLSQLSDTQRQQMAQTIARLEETEPSWLKREIAAHLRQVRHFWRLYPGVLSNRFSQLRNVRGLKSLVCYPAAVASFGLAAISSWLAFRALQSGCTDYWPKAERAGLRAPAHREPQPAEIPLIH